jgi:hypothetical protein
MTAPQAGPPAAASPAVVRLGAAVIALGSVIAGKTMVACGLRRLPEGWRRTLGILLRSEPTRFALSAFGVSLPAAAAAAQDPVELEQRSADALRTYLAGQPDAQFALEWRQAITIRRPTRSVDVVLLRFAAGGDLETLTPHLADAGSSTGHDAQRTQVHGALVTAYNRTRRLPEVERPSALRHALDAACAQPSHPDAEREMKAYARRLLSACCLSFEDIDLRDQKQRFRPPDFCSRRNFGFGSLTVVLRLAPERRAVDVWMSVHHVALDGVPLQELISGLESTWGTSEHVVYPAADPDRPFMDARGCSMPGERDVQEMLAFVDFSPVLALRETLNARYAQAAGGSITLGAILAWLLNLEPEFSGVRIASTVDVAASGGYDRDVDVVPLRPADFVSGPDPWDGFAAFAAEFNRLIALSRARTSPLRRGLQTAGLLPAWVHAHSVRSNPAALDATFGSLCITIIRDAKVFMAPMTDLGLGHGFFAIGNTNLPAPDGRRVTAVSIKGHAGTIARHHAVLQRVIQRSLERQPSDLPK